jgi:ketosteroid isomerase-like protein
MKRFIYCVVIASALYSCTAKQLRVGTEADLAALEQTSKLIHAAFAKGDVKEVMKFHHPDVVKALDYNTFLNGRNAVEANLAGTFKSFKLEFIGNKVEDVYFEGQTATQINLFTIKGTPKVGGQPFVFKGRAIVEYVRYKDSPTGWASIREVVQPAP